ncbi:TauD/TfdA dioxygenase family protein [Kitasatospora sp. NPDC057940]|uniref:TauD/TfdA dioxygenase family protein n=1 Tax=Kitasatospora sp. NPDC057940 TaxID=3346285 RepID=UPI0036DBC5D0
MTTTPTHPEHTGVDAELAEVRSLARRGIEGRTDYHGPRLLRRLAEGRQGGPYEHFEVRPSGPLIGAEIHGIDLRTPLSDEVFGELDRALLEWKVLFFRDQDLTAEQQRAFACRWGAIEGHPFLPAGTGEDVVRLEKGKQNPGFENVWHYDFPWIERPPLGAVLRMVELPEGGGGDTLFTDAAAAYDNLPDEVKARIDGLKTVNDFTPSANYRELMTDEQRAHFQGVYPPVEHPLVRTHPKTGRKTLFLTSIFTTHIAGLPADESEELLAYLFRQLEYPEYQVRFRWEAKSIAFWDNRAVQHYATSDYHPNRRVVDRTAIAGDRPF